MVSPLIRRAAPDDIDPMLALERESATAAHWSESQYRDLFSGTSEPSARAVWVAEESTKILGFLVAAHLGEEWELENVVVSPAARRSGIAKALLEALLAEAAKTNNASVFLEVRESNLPARALYEKAGFRITGRRKSYYSNPQEDAILHRWRPAKSFS